MARVTKLQQIKSGSKTVVLWDQWLVVKNLHIVLLTGTIYSVCLFPPGFNKQTEASDCFHSLRHSVLPLLHCSCNISMHLNKRLSMRHVYFCKMSEYSSILDNQTSYVKDHNKAYHFLSITPSLRETTRTEN